MRRGMLWVVVTFIVFGAIGHRSASAEFLYVDFGLTGSVVQPGWQPFEGGSSVPGTTAHTFTNQFGLGEEIEVSVWATNTATGAGANHGFRQRSSLITSHPDYYMNNLLRTEVKSHATDDGELTLHLQLPDLIPGSYDLTTYHHQGAGSSPGRVDILLDDANGMGQLVTEDFQQSHGTNPASVATHTLRFHADGINPVVIHFREIDGSTTGHHEAVLSGFMMIPEPSSLLLLAFGLACLVVPARRKRGR